MCLNEIYSGLRIGKYLSDKFLIQNGLKQRDALSPLLLNFAFDYAFRRIQKKRKGLKLNGTHHLLAYADDVNILGESIDTIQKNTEALLNTNKEVGVEINPDKPKHVLLSCCRKAGQKHSIKIPIDPLKVWKS
jgi:hypothetical protein